MLPGWLRKAVHPWVSTTSCNSRPPKKNPFGRRHGIMPMGHRCGIVVYKKLSGPERRQCDSPYIPSPAMRPQKALPTPRNGRPEPVTKKVMAAATRSSGFSIADVRAAAKAPSSARPATAAIGMDGAAAEKAVMAPANRRIRFTRGALNPGTELCRPSQDGGGGADRAEQGESPYFSSPAASVLARVLSHRTSPLCRGMFGHRSGRCMVSQGL